MTKIILIFAIIFSILTLSSCDAKPGETPTDPTNEESTVLPEAPSDEEQTKDDEDGNTVSENVTEESEEPTEDDKGENTVSENMTEESEEPTEPVSDMPTDETAVEKVEIPELNADNLAFTMELAETVYTTSSEKITYRIRSKEPAEYIVRGDQWKLYRIDGDKATLLGETMFCISVEIHAESGKEYVDRESIMLINELCGKKTLEAGKYCMIYYHSSSSGIAMYFEVVE